MVASVAGITQRQDGIGDTLKQGETREKMPYREVI